MRLLERWKEMRAKAAYMELLSVMWQIKEILLSLCRHTSDTAHVNVNTIESNDQGIAVVQYKIEINSNRIESSCWPP